MKLTAALVAAAVLAASVTVIVIEPASGVSLAGEAGSRAGTAQLAPGTRQDKEELRKQFIDAYIRATPSEPAKLEYIMSQRDLLDRCGLTPLFLDTINELAQANPKGIPPRTIPFLCAIVKHAEPLKPWLSEIVKQHATHAINILESIALEANALASKEAAEALEAITTMPDIEACHYATAAAALRRIGISKPKFTRVATIILTSSNITLGVVNNSFERLPIDGLMRGTRTYLKLLLLGEAAQKGEISKSFIKYLEEEVMPALRILENITKDQPAIYLEVPKEGPVLKFITAPHSYPQPLLPPTSYPIMALLLDKLQELNPMDVPSYITYASGDYFDETFFLLSALFLTNLSPEQRLPYLNISKYPELSKYADYALGAWIFDWNVKELNGLIRYSSFSPEIPEQTFTVLFHAAISASCRRRYDIAPIPYRDDLRRTTVLLTAVKQAPGLYQELKKEILTYLKEGDAFFLIPQRDGWHPRLDSLTPSYLRNRLEGLAHRLSATETPLAQFQEIVNRHVDLIEAQLLKGIDTEILDLATRGQWRQIKRRLESAAFSDDETSKKALEYLRIGGYPEAGKIERFLRSPASSSP